MESETINQLLSEYNWTRTDDDVRNAKIYCISNNKTDRVYIGSTCKPLDQIFLDHLYYYRAWSNISKYRKKKYKGVVSYKVFMDGYSTISLVEEYPCDDVRELRMREGEIRRRYPSAVNKKISGRSIKQWKDEKRCEKMLAVKAASVPSPEGNTTAMKSVMKNLSMF